jgi:hypothetical protein
MPASPFPRQVLLPALALAATFGVALGLAEGPGKSAEADLHRAVLAYHRALFDGQAEAARGAIVQNGPAAERGAAERAADRRGRPWLVQSLSVPRPGEGKVDVALFVDAAGEMAVIETEEWRRDAAGRWRLHDFQERRETPQVRRRR